MSDTSGRRGARATPGVLVRLALGGGVLAFVVSRVDLGGLTLRWDGRLAAGFAATVAIVVAAQFLSSVRWRLVLGEGDAAPLPYLFRLYLAGLFFSLFLPTSVGGDAVRAVAISRTARRPAWAVSSVVFERFIGLVAMFTLLAVGGLAAPEVFHASAGRASFGWSPTDAQIMIAVIVAVIGGMAALAVLRRSAAVRKVAAEAAGLWTGFAARPGAFAAAFGVSLLVQASYVAAWWVLAAAVRLPVGPAEMLVFVPFVSVAAMLPLTVSGIGLREGAWVLLLAPYGVAGADAVAYSLVYFLAFLLVGGAGGAWFAVAGLAPAGAREREASETETALATGAMA